MKEMGFEQFRQELISEIKKLENQSMKIEEKNEVKNNGVVCHGVALRRPGNSTEVVIYYDHWYEDYREGKPIEDIIWELRADYMEHGKIPDYRAEQFTVVDNVKDRVIFRLINHEQNKDRLERMPHIRVLDMALVLCIYVDENESGELTIQIDDRYMSNAGVTSGELFRWAYENTERLKPARVKNMGWFLMEMAGLELEQYEDVEDWKMFCGATGMYVLSNETGINGAAVMFYPGMLRRLAEDFKSDFVIFPSSIHECIAYPLTEIPELDELKGIVKEVNQSCVQPQEILSDRVYLYERKYNRLSLAFPEDGIEPVRLDSLTLLKPCCHGGKEKAA